MSEETIPGRKIVLDLIIGKDRYYLTYRAGSEDAVFRHLDSMADNSDLNFDDKDAKFMKRVVEMNRRGKGYQSIF